MNKQMYNVEQSERTGAANAYASYLKAKQMFVHTVVPN